MTYFNRLVSRYGENISLHSARKIQSSLIFLISEKNAHEIGIYWASYFELDMASDIFNIVADRNVIVEFGVTIV